MLGFEHDMISYYIKISRQSPNSGFNRIKISDIPSRDWHDINLVVAPGLFPLETGHGRRNILNNNLAMILLNFWLDLAKMITRDYDKATKRFDSANFGISEKFSNLKRFASKNLYGNKIK